MRHSDTSHRRVYIARRSWSCLRTERVLWFAYDRLKLLLKEKDKELLSLRELGSDTTRRISQLREEFENLRKILERSLRLEVGER